MGFISLAMGAIEKSIVEFKIIFYEPILVGKNDQLFLTSFNF